jgi:hypothetical protein
LYIPLVSAWLSTATLPDIHEELRPAKDGAAVAKIAIKKCPEKNHNLLAARASGQDFEVLISFIILEQTCPNVMHLILASEFRKRYYCNSFSLALTFACMSRCDAKVLTYLGTTR